MIHNLKTWPEYFEQVVIGTKTFEIRKNDDRTFSVGDILKLEEFDSVKQEYTGRISIVIVTYILAEQPFVPEGYVCMGIRKHDSSSDTIAAQSATIAQLQDTITCHENDIKRLMHDWKQTIAEKAQLQAQVEKCRIAIKWAISIICGHDKETGKETGCILCKALEAAEKPE